MKARLALGLVILSLFLLIVYGADEGAKQGNEEGGFLHLDVMVRGIGFGGTAVVLSTVAFFISIKERATLVSILLLFNGVLIIIGGARTGPVPAIARRGLWRAPGPARRVRSAPVEWVPPPGPPAAPLHSFRTPLVIRIRLASLFILFR